MVLKPEFANSCRLLTGKRKYRGALWVAAGAVEFIPDEGQSAPPVRVPIADLRAMRQNSASHVFFIFSANNESYCFEMPPRVADELAVALRAVQPGIPASHSAFLPRFSPEVPALEGPVAVEMGAGLTVEGKLTLTDRTLRFVPSFSARLLGRRSYAVPLSQAASRRDDNDASKVKFRVSGDTQVMSGVGAQHVCLGMQLLECAAVEAKEVQPFAIREDRRGAFAQEALLGLTASHVGAARAEPLGGEPLSFWCPIAAVQSIEPEGLESVVVAPGLARYPVRGLGADDWISALRIRWLSVAPPPTATEDSHCTPAVLVAVSRTLFGHLTVSTSGIVFYPSQGESVELALPGDKVEAKLDPDHVHNLRLGVDGAHHAILLLDAAAIASEIAVTVNTTSWALGRADLGGVPLTTEEVYQFVGHAHYVRLFIDDVVVAVIEERVVAPQVRDLQCPLLLVADRPQIPCLADLEVVSPKGRFLAHVQVLRIGDDASQGNGVRPVRFLLRLMSRAKSCDRRDPNRMKTDEPIDVHWIVAGKMMFLQGDVRMVNLSVSGCALDASEAPDDGTVCAFLLMRSGARPDDLPFEVHGVVTSVTQAKDKRFRVGVNFVDVPSPPRKQPPDGGAPADLAGTLLYQDRERQILKDLADQRALEQEWRRE